MNGTLKRTLNGHTSGVFALTLLQNGDLANGSANRTIKIWNQINGTFKRTLNGQTSGVLARTVL